MGGAAARSAHPCPPLPQRLLEHAGGPPRATLPSSAVVRRRARQRPRHRRSRTRPGCPGADPPGSPRILARASRQQRRLAEAASALLPLAAPALGGSDPVRHHGEPHDRRSLPRRIRHRRRRRPQRHQAARPHADAGVPSAAPRPFRREPAESPDREHDEGRGAVDLRRDTGSLPGRAGHRLLPEPHGPRRRAGRQDPDPSPVPSAELIETLNDYDVGIHVLPPTNTNNELALPNKFFDYVQARLALVIGPTPSMVEILREHDLGIVTADFEPASLTAALDALTPSRSRASRRGRTRPQPSSPPSRRTTSGTGRSRRSSRRTEGPRQ